VVPVIHDDVLGAIGRTPLVSPSTSFDEAWRAKRGV
jgi:hypothetical protein